VGTLSHLTEPGCCLVAPLDLHGRSRWYTAGFAWVVVMLSGCGLSPVVASDPVPAEVTAIVVALVPDAALRAQALAINTRLRLETPRGYAFDATHQPHISVLQRYVLTADLDAVRTVVGQVVASEDPASWRLQTNERYAIPWDGTNLVSIMMEPSEPVLRFQRRLMDALAPYTVPLGTAAAFLTMPAEPPASAATVAYVGRFVPDATGDQYNPHLSVGIGGDEQVRELLAEPVAALEVAPVGVAIYQLGDFGAARRELAAWRTSEFDRGGRASE